MLLAKAVALAQGHILCVLELFAADALPRLCHTVLGLLAMSLLPSLSVLQNVCIPHCMRLEDLPGLVGRGEPRSTWGIHQ